MLPRHWVKSRTYFNSLNFTAMLEMGAFFKKQSFIIIIFDLRERGRERERETLICCSTYLYIHWLLIVPMSWDWTCNLGVSGRCSNQLSYLARVWGRHFCCLQLTEVETEVPTQQSGSLLMSSPYCFSGVTRRARGRLSTEWDWKTICCRVQCPPV